MSRASFGKPLKGGTVSANLTTQSLSTVAAAISGGLFPMSNINITGGSIDGVIFGNSTPGPIIATTFQSGNSQGQGYSVCFYGQTIGDSACWDPVTGTWNIKGDLSVRDISDLGNLRLTINTISATNTNGSITLQPNGTGNITLSGPINQSTSNGNISFNTTNGSYILSTSNSITSTSGKNTVFNTLNGDLSWITGLSIPTLTISFITTGTSVTITTTSIHNLSTGDYVRLSSTNCTPTINGVYTVTSIVSTVSFTITSNVTVTSSGTSGNVKRLNNINLTATDYINIPNAIQLNFGKNTNYISASNNDLTVASNGSIYITPTTSLILPDNIPINFASTGNYIENNGTNTTINTLGTLFLKNTQIDGNLTVNGTTTQLNTVETVTSDPVLTIGTQVNDSKDRGVQFENYTTSAKVGFFGYSRATGCFTYIPDATNTNEVFTGTPGCAQFGALSVTSIDINGGGISNLGSLSVSSINTCTISCTGTLSLTGSTGISLTGSTLINNGLTVTGTTILNNTLTVNGTNTIINSTNVTVADPVLTIGSSSNDSKSRGIEFSYNNVGYFFGRNPTTGCFTYLTNTTNNSEAITGALGCAAFGSTSVTSLDLGNGNVTNVNSVSTNSISASSINTCNISCSGTLTLTGISGISLVGLTTANNGLTVNGSLISNNDLTVNGTNTTINSTNVTISDPVLTIGSTSADSKSRGIEFSYNNVGYFFGRNPTTGCFTYLTSTTNTNEQITGSLGCATFGNTTVNDLTVNGTLTIPGGLPSGADTVEHLSASSGTLNPSGSINITFIVVSAAAMVTGTLPLGTYDGFRKIILISSMTSGGSYVLTTPVGSYVDPISQSTSSHTLTFTRTGQGVMLYWDNNLQRYIAPTGGFCLS